MSSSENLTHYEKISWLIICETITLAILFYLIKSNSINQNVKYLFFSIILYLQIPAAKFIAEYLSRRLDKIKKFFVTLAIVTLFLIAVLIIISALVYQTLPTLVGLILFGVTIWLTFFPPNWFKEIVDKWKKKK